MRIRLLTITHKTPGWLQEGFQEYAKRLPATCRIELVEIPAEKRTNNANIPGIIEREGSKLIAAIKSNHRVIALDVQGKQWSTEQLSGKLSEWLQEGRNIDLLVGGPDGLSQACLDKADEQWSLSSLTFPHIFIKLIVAEQLYRAHSLLHNHPYHR